MIFQQFNLIPRLNAITYVMLGRLKQLNLLRSFVRIFPEKDIADALTNLERLDIADKAKRLLVEGILIGRMIFS